MDELVTIATDWMKSETLRDERLREIGRAWCALMGAGDVGRIKATVEELVRRTGEKEWDVYSRMINVAMMYMHSLVSGIVVKNDACGCSCGCEDDESVDNTHAWPEG